MRDLELPATQAAPYIESEETTYTNNAIVLIAHGLGVVPKDWHVIIRCKTAEAGYSVGDEIDPGWFVVTDGSSYGSQTFADATNIGVVCASSGFRMFAKNTRSNSSPTPANWRIVARWRS
jgi:hypothetical protein